MTLLSPTTSTLAFIEGIGGPELLMVMVIVLILFGGKKLPEFARGLGKSMREIKKATSGVEEEFKRAMEEEPERPKRIAPAQTPTASPAPSKSEATTKDQATTPPAKSPSSPKGETPHS